MGATVSKVFTARKKQNTSSTSSRSSRGGGRGRVGDSCVCIGYRGVDSPRGRGDGDVVEEGADDKQQLSATANVDNDDLQRQMEKARLNQKLVLSNDLVSYIRRLCESTMN